MSTKPGVTVSPSASSTRAAARTSASLMRPMRAMRPSRTPRSATYGGTPVPSTTRPPRMMRSKGAVTRRRLGRFDARDHVAREAGVLVDEAVGIEVGRAHPESQHDVLDAGGGQRTHIVDELVGRAGEQRTTVLGVRGWRRVVELGP